MMSLLLFYSFQLILLFTLGTQKNESSAIIITVIPRYHTSWNSPLSPIYEIFVVSAPKLLGKYIDKHCTLENLGTLEETIQPSHVNFYLMHF